MADWTTDAVDTLEQIVATVRDKTVVPAQRATRAVVYGLLVGLNGFEPGQSHALHAHAGMDKMYYVLDGEGVFLLADSELPMRAGDLLMAPEGVPHGVRNTGPGRLLVLAVLAPSP